MIIPDTDNATIIIDVMSSSVKYHRLSHSFVIFQTNPAMQVFILPNPYFHMELLICIYLDIALAVGSCLINYTQSSCNFVQSNLSNE